jgi:serine protease inhibitor
MTRGRAVFSSLLLLLLLPLHSRQQDLSPITAMGMRLAALLEKQPGPNFVVSPVSAAAVFSMLAMGAKGGTLAELEQLIGEPAANSSQRYSQIIRELGEVAAANQVELRMANLLALAKGFTPKADYRSLLENLFQTRVEVMDFRGNPAGSVARINSFVSRLTGRVFMKS